MDDHVVPDVDARVGHAAPHGIGQYITDLPRRLAGHAVARDAFQIPLLASVEVPILRVGLGGRR